MSSKLEIAMNEAYKKANENSYTGKEFKFGFWNGFKDGTKYMKNEYEEKLRWNITSIKKPRIRKKPYQILIKSDTGHITTYHIVDKRSIAFMNQLSQWRNIL